jgi:hypothetical protein
LSKFSELIKDVITELITSGQLNPDQVRGSYEKILETTADTLHKALEASQTASLSDLSASMNGFLERNYKRWKEGFDRLQLFRHYCMEAGQAFQQKFLRYPQFVNDPLLGVLMRLHAHACRITGEVIALLTNGYADGALSRWRTLHEIAVTSMLLKKHGRAAAEDYIRYGLVQSVNGMKGYQETAEAMRRKPYSTEELGEAEQLRQAILDKYGKDFCSRNGWARKYIGSSRFDNLQKAIGLEKWRNDYASASRDIHTDYRDMRTLFAMSEAKHNMILCGPSNSGMAEPAHSTAIALSQITATFIFTYADDESCPIDYTDSAIYGKLLSRLVDEIGKTFLALDNKPQDAATHCLTPDKIH